MSIAARVLYFFLRGYKLILSPILPQACRFQPTCSEYAMEAVQRYGFFKGAWLSIRRLVRCQPFCRGGFDPVPEQEVTATDQGH